MEQPTSRRPLAPTVIAAVAVAVVCLGFWGFAVHQPQAPVTEHLYRSLQFFAFESGDLGGAVPWQLEVSRLAAPALTVASALVAVALLSRDRVDRWRVRRWSGHVVVCGLGERGTLAALVLRVAGHRVVGIEIDHDGAGSARCRRARIPVIIGDGRDPHVLRTAGVGRAAHLLVLNPVLGISGQVALAAAETVGPRDGDPLTIHVAVADPHLAALLRALELTEHRSTLWRLEDLDLPGMGARAALDALPAWADGAAGSQAHPHVIVAGTTPLAVAVREELTRRWIRQGGSPEGLTVTAVDDAVMKGVCSPATAAYVCLADEPAAIAAALALVGRLPGTPVLVHLEQATALAELLQRDLPQLHPMSLVSRAFTPEALLDSTVERIARALHDEYRRSTAADDPSAVSWDALPVVLKASNRAHAAHVATKLRATGRVVVPDDGLPPDGFDEDEIELLGRLEHERWMTERLAAGWRAGPRDSTARTSPFLVPWEQLDDDTREVDRRFARQLPDIVADAGLTVRRIARAPLRPATSSPATWGPPDD